MMGGERRDQPHDAASADDQNASAASKHAVDLKQDPPSQTEAFEEEGAGLAAKE